VPLLYVTEGLAMGTFQIFNLPQPTGVRDLKSEGPPIAGPSPIQNGSLSLKTTMSIGFWIHVKTNCFQSP
jgi:hypothetical protein